MSFEATIPKYAVVVEAARERIRNGTYEIGDTLPSEAQLMAEFNVARTTIVRALQILAQEGWVEAHQGKGRTVVGVPASAEQEPRQVPDHALALLGYQDAANVRLVDVGPVLASERIAYALGVKAGTPVMARRRIAETPEVGPVELTSVYMPVARTADTDFASESPLGENLLTHLRRRRNLAVVRAAEIISCRPATDEENALLSLPAPDEWVLTMLITAFDGDDTPVFAVDSVIAPSRQQLEDSYVLTPTAGM